MRVLLIISLFIGSYVNAQSDWSPLVSKDGVVVSFKKMTCGEEGFFVLKFENNNTADVSLIWDMHLWVDKECTTCQDPSGNNHCILSLSSGEKKEGTCIYSDDRRFCVSEVVVEHGRDRGRLTNLQLSNFRVLKLGR